VAEGTCFLPVEKVRQFVTGVFAALGVPAGDAEIASDVLVTADLFGIESHGIGRLRYYYDRLKRGQHQPVTRFEVVREGPATALVDAHHGMGQVIGVRAMQLAIDKARACGMASVAVRNSTHYGIAGYYPLMAVRSGMIGLTCTNARPAVAPTFSIHPMLGTNPLAFGAPTDEEDCPFLFDAATSIVQRGKYEVLEREGKPGTAGWAIDRSGNDVNDPAAVLGGLEARLSESASQKPPALACHIRAIVKAHRHGFPAHPIEPIVLKPNPSLPVLQPLLKGNASVEAPSRAVPVRPSGYLNQISRD